MHFSIIAQVLCEMGLNVPQRRFFLKLFPLWFSVRGRLNFLNIGRYALCHERTLRRWFSREFSWPEFNSRLMMHLMPVGHELIAAMDASFVSKSGKKTSGLGYFFNGSANRAEKGLEVSLVSVVDLTRNTAYALSARQTQPEDRGQKLDNNPKGKKLQGSKPENDNHKIKESKTKETRIDDYLKQLQDVRLLLPKAVRHLAVDGYYTHHKFVQGVCALEMDVVGKLRRDANLQYLYRGPQKKRGRRRVYAGKVPWSNLDMRRWKDEGLLEPGVQLYSARLHHVTLKRELRVVVLQEVKSGRMRQAILFSTDLELSGRDIVRYYKARFQIEFMFRDAKQGTGLNHCQARSAKALEFHWNVAFCAINIAKWQDGARNEKGTFSVASCKQRYSNEHLLQMFSQRLGFDWNFIKSQTCFTDLCNYGAIRA